MDKAYKELEAGSGDKMLLKTLRSKVVTLEEEVENLEAEASSGNKAIRELKALQQERAIERERWEQEKTDTANEHGAAISELQAQLTVAAQGAP